MIRYSLILFLSLFIFSQNSFAQENDRYRLLFSDEVFFGPGDASLGKNYHNRLEAVAKVIAEEEVEKIIVQAHTDSIGTEASNEKLSYERASSIVEFLKKKGVDVNLMEIRTYGEYNPIAENNTAEGRAKNRRVSISVLGPYDPSRYGTEAKIHGQVVDARTQTPLANARVLMIYLGGFDTLQTDAEGKFEKTFSYMTNVEVRAYAKNYFFVSKIAKLKHKEMLEMDFQLEPAIIGGKMFLSDLYFKPGTALLLPSSEKALEGILSFMQYNDQLKFEIGGHINKPNADKVHPKSSSFLLSENRAKAVYDYLTENGIPEDRLSYQGYGNWEMINPNANTELQMQMNRRVELKIVE
jgi:outer membrane protein OmpA-like peptidoglycan-associated protein